MQRLRDFVRREVVLVVAIVLAAASCIAVPPDAAYSAYIDWHTLALLFCLMAVVAGLRSLGVLDSMGKWLVSRAKSQRAIAFALVGIAFFASMAVTNDVALITFVPLALVTLRAAGMEGRALLVAALMTVAANLGSMLTPVGNPQNLYLFTASGMSVSPLPAAHGTLHDAFRSPSGWVHFRAVQVEALLRGRGWQEQGLRSGCCSWGRNRLAVVLVRWRRA